MEDPPQRQLASRCRRLLLRTLLFAVVIGASVVVWPAIFLLVSDAFSGTERAGGIVGSSVDFGLAVGGFAAAITWRSAAVLLLAGGLVAHLTVRFRLRYGLVASAAAGIPVVLVLFLMFLTGSGIS